MYRVHGQRGLQRFLQCTCYNLCVDESQDQLKKTPKGLGPNLESLMVTPVQRIPRYMILIRELLNMTPDSHPDKQNLQVALEKIMKITEDINVDIKETDKIKEFGAVVETVQGIKVRFAG